MKLKLSLPSNHVWIYFILLLTNIEQDTLLFER